MAGTAFRTLPQVFVGNSITYRNIFTTIDTVVNGQVPSFYILDGTLSRDPGQGGVTGGTVSLVRTGVILGKETLSGKYRPSIIGLLNRTNNTAATSLTLAPAVATEVQRQIGILGTSNNFVVVSPTTSGGTVISTTVSATSAVTGTSGTTSYVILSASINTATVTGGYIGGTDGSAIPATVLCDNNIGIDVVDQFGAGSIDQQLQRFIIKGDFLSGMIVNLLRDDYGVATDSAITTYLETKLQAQGRAFTFSDNR